MVVYGVLGSIILWPTISYCSESFYPLTDHPDWISIDSPTREKVDGIIALITKVPFFLVWLNWGQSHPLAPLAKVTLFVFVTTKPFPSSVYLVLDRLRHQITSQQPFYRFKDSTISHPQAQRVEVEDYTFLRRVEIKDGKLELIGIFCCWWILSLSSHNSGLFRKSKPRVEVTSSSNLHDKSDTTRNFGFSK
ncbi:uncharacterized protein [Henckelia pumila]|uniref:uncharacterized protein isoform X1 n=1 Tax=Henckelia pumila TaxID=405737 RepID=UPI003C6E7FD1